MAYFIEIFENDTVYSRVLRRIIMKPATKRFTTLTALALTSVL